jgi:hypothetical protein
MPATYDTTLTKSTSASEAHLIVHQGVGEAFDQTGTLSGSSGPGIGSAGAGGSVSGVSDESSLPSSGIGSLGSIGG